MYSLVSILERVLKPAIDYIRDYGHCNDMQKSNFKYGVNRFINFLKSTEKDISQRIVFEVDRDLYMGFLLTAIQVQETAHNREKMGRVEHIFARWMEQVQYALTQGDQIEQAPHYAGPLVELEYWRTVLKSRRKQPYCSHAHGCRTALVRWQALWPMLAHCPQCAVALCSVWCRRHRTPCGTDSPMYCERNPCPTLLHQPISPAEWLKLLAARNGTPNLPRTGQFRIRFS